MLHDLEVHHKALVDHACCVAIVTEDCGWHEDSDRSSLPSFVVLITCACGVHSEEEHTGELLSVGSILYNRTKRSLSYEQK